VAKLKELTRQAVRDWVGDREIEKGRPYAEGAVSGTVRVGDTLKAQVQGTAHRPYRVRLALRGGEVISGDCSCPVGDGGRCKHAAAVLLAYLTEPERFGEMDDLDANLQARDKAELVALIKQMIRRSPELEPLLAAPVPGFRKSSVTVTPDAYRRLALDVIRQSDPYEEWAGDEIAEGLSDILDHGTAFEQAGDFASAAAVYQGITSAVADEEIDYLGGYDDVPGTTGELAGGLLRCLKHLPGGSAKRESVLRSLFALLQLNGDLGYDASGKELLPQLLKAVTPDERRTLSRWLRQEARSKKANRYADEYTARRVADLLLTIDADVMDDEQYLDHCRRFGLRAELLTRLVKLGRTDEAVREVAGTNNNSDFLRGAEQLADLGLGDEAERLVRARKGWEKDHLFVQWLKQRAVARKDAAEVVRLGELMLGIWPSLQEYLDIRKWAGAGWPAKREKLLRDLERRKSFVLLTDIYLKEGLIDDAIRTLRLDPYSGRKLEVAKAAEATRPEVSIELYRKAAERTIEGRNRSAYAEACKQLKKVGELMTRLGQGSEFRTYIAGLAEKYRALRAFQEELRKAKLLTEVPTAAVALKSTKRKPR
jgi:hypothetical protein